MFPATSDTDKLELKSCSNAALRFMPRCNCTNQDKPETEQDIYIINDGTQVINIAFDRNKNSN